MALVDFRRNFGSPLDTDLSSVNSYIFLSNLGLHESTVGVAFSHIYSGVNTSELMASENRHFYMLNQHSAHVIMSVPAANGAQRRSDMIT